MTLEGRYRALRGTLEEFTLAELLQLLALSEKSGTVTIHLNDRRSRLFFEAGRVVGWGVDGYDVYQSILGCRLLAPSTIVALESVEPEPDTPALAFVVRNIVEPERWDAFVRRLLEQDVYPILTLDNGEFDVAIERISSVPVSFDMSVQQLILDGSRWEADTGELTREGYGSGSRWRRTVSEDRSLDDGFSLLQWLVLTQLSDPLTISEVARAICHPDLETAEVVKELHSRKLVEQAL